MEISSDPYEQKLYHMFKSYDTDAIGSLDQTALSKLCKSLELSDQGNALINSLMTSPATRVTFREFKEGLLNFLGTEMEESNHEKTLVFNEDESLHGAPDSPRREISPKLVMGTKKYGRRSRPQSLVSNSSPSDSDTETIAVVPNVNNGKVQRSSSQSELQGPGRRRTTNGSKLKRCASLPAQKNRRFREPLQKPQDTITQKQNASSVESLGNLDFENLSHTLHELWTQYCNELGTQFLNRHELVTVCERVGLNKIADKVAEEVFEKLHLTTNEKISFDEFIGLIHSDATTDAGFIAGGGNGGVGGRNNFATTISTAANDNDRTMAAIDITSILIRDDLCNRMDPIVVGTMADNDLHANKETPQNLPTCDIIEMWETAGIGQPKKLMSSLGFDDEIVSITTLANALEDELRTCPNESDMLLKAALALHKAEIVALKQAFRQLMEENKQIRTDNRDVNKRAAILAQEIDERHAALENTTRSEIRMLEQRHAEVVRELTAQLASDRENWSNLNVRLEARIKNFELEEVKYKLEIQTLHDENGALEKEQISLQKQITELLETNIKLNNEIVDLEEKQRCDDGSKGVRETEEVLELFDKVTQLQTENANLRDKNDELVAEIEGLNVELNRSKSKKSPRSGSETTGDNLSDDAEHSSLGVKRRGDSPSKTRITEESPRLGKFRKCSNENSENEASGDWVALNSELGSNLSSTTIGASSSGFSQDISSVFDSKDEEIDNLKEKIVKLENELAELKKKSAVGRECEKNSNDDFDYKARCQELENSLEQMRKAYEDCEDYWQSKLGEERQLFEKERQIYEEEQQESDKKFAELMEKVREYEEQFSKDGRLSPIDERDNLEQQYADLEAEAEELRNNAKKMFEEKTKEIIKLQEKIVELQNRLGGGAFEISGDDHRLIKHEPSELESVASSPICYLWNQSTIQAPARDYQNPNWDNKPKKEAQLSNLTTSETSIFSTVEHTQGDSNDTNNPRISPIQKPNTPSSRMQRDADETASIASGRSFESRSVASTHSVHKTSIGDLSTCSSPNGLKEELKRLKVVEIQLKEQIKDLALKRDGLVMELQQLHEAKPVLEKAYARAAHPSLLQRINHLEQKNRHLQTVLRQQQQYTESIMHQTWQQQRSEIGELRNRLETQNLIMSEQVQRLANADLLVKDLYVENSHLAANIQRLEQQRSRANLIHQHHQGLSGVPGMP